jgi:prevent-host-death family protein
MNHTVSATEARVHFGELMRRAKFGPVIVERDGKPDVVVISKQEYDRLKATSSQPEWRQLLKEAHESIAAAIGNQPLPDPAEMIRQGREERDEELLNSLR